MSASQLTDPIPPGKTRKEYMEGIAYVAYTYGFVPIPLRGKIPVMTKWNHYRNTPAEDAQDIAAGKYPKNVRIVGHRVGKDADNVGIVTGEASGVVVLDIDVKNDGLEKWRQLLDANTDGKGLPKTLTVQTPSGGFHFYFRYTPDLANIGNIGRLYGYPFDYRTNNGMIVFPGSIDEQNRQYKILSGYEPLPDNLSVNAMYIAHMPTWLKTLLVMDRITKENKKLEVNVDTITDKARQLQITL
jgi:Bifunctional DNA primase/polymerase, N-terminal